MLVFEIIPSLIFQKYISSYTVKKLFSHEQEI